jgi:transcriptional regulator with XRE-family HTH domain
MARPPVVRTNLARLRLSLSMGQSSFARLLGRSLAAVQSLESARLALSRQLAGEISSRTGVSADWLLDNDLDEAPYDLVGKPWTLQTYQKLQAEIPHDLKEGDEVFRQRMLELGTQLSTARNLAGLKRVYRSLHNGGQALEIGRRVDQFLATLMAELNVKPDVNMMEEIRFAELEADRKTQNALRVMGVSTPPVVPLAPPVSYQKELPLSDSSGKPMRKKGAAMVGAAWREISAQDIP